MFGSPSMRKQRGRALGVDLANPKVGFRDVFELSWVEPTRVGRRSGHPDPRLTKVQVDTPALLLFLLLCGAVRGCTGQHGGGRVIGETPARGHDLVRSGTG